MLESSPLPSPGIERFELSITESSADVLVVGLAEGEDRTATLHEINAWGDGWIDRLVERGLVNAKCGEVNKLVSPFSAGAPIILMVGVGKLADLTRSHAFDLTATAVRALADPLQRRIEFAMAECFDASAHDALVAGALNACENQAIYQSDPKALVPKTLAFSGLDEEAIRRGKIVGDSMVQTRRWVNEPPSRLYPESFANAATALAADVGLSVEVWDETRLEAEGCRAILAVGSGSSRPPRLVLLRHHGGGSEPPIALVGKGVTFDSGGLSLKPSESMADMKCDMAGAATVLGVMSAIARLGVKRNVIGLCGLAENMVSGDSYKLGDVIETRKGTTIEILNTDAEGRVVLADTLDVAVQFSPSAMVDLATLTGACMVALGTEVAGLMTNEQSICDQLSAAAQSEGEPVWQLPMFDLYDEKVKSKVADIKNVGEGRWGGAITAAKFLQQFVGDTPWVHIDIAGPAFADSAKPHRDAGATGVMVRTLLNWIENR
ncbi:leucyl aminopeptidase [Novipirellula artificiosorum]|uniref:Probable cytosol aminopeptidase n=1 Tax=Novipirellula artificiosorum TaxID=2528016 RepID=A0A5C6DM94_9BACT|nr:leucyl aminopeptidase [Novipirellula artificiosorum]TWU35979.1 Cytosol aminopeptidase [Novipirellula artificiosorum]